MGTPDLDDRELDLIYERTEKRIDVRKINSEDELKKAVEPTLNRAGLNQKWGDKLNQLVFGKLNRVRESIKESILGKAKKSKVKVDIGVVSEKKFQAVFNKRSKSSYFVARGAKGRFTKYSKEELNEVIYNARM